MKHHLDGHERYRSGHHHHGCAWDVARLAATAAKAAPFFWKEKKKKKGTGKGEKKKEKKV